tara:strand:+ start:32689 stop:33120 length:432 start_codon:yes stop_codon:yes gene_type:complete
MMTAMAQVKEGDQVAIRFRAIASDRRVLATTGTGPALNIIAGSEDVLYGLSHGIIGMSPGEKAVLTIDAEDAFGEAEEAIERTIPRSRFPNDVQVGDALKLRCEQSEILLWVVEEGAGDTWRLSSQHPFAGQGLELHIEVVDV